VKFRDLLDAAEEEVRVEAMVKARARIKTLIQELKKAKKVVASLEKELELLLEEDI